jgi:uncharacterized repeat protein (TIGR03803 family)
METYGVTTGGPDTDSPGTVFRMTATGAGAYASLHAFTGGAGGSEPKGSLLRASDGNVYGTTASGGAFDAGTIFRLTPAGGFAVVHSFDGTDGAHPQAGLIQATDGNLYGTTEFGGPDSNGGVVYRVTLPPCTDTLV